MAMQISASLSVDERSVLTRSTDAKPDPADRVDEGVGLLTVDLAADASDIDVDDVGRWIEVKIPDMLQQHCPGYHATFVAHQILQKLEFPRKKGNLLTASAGGTRHQVNREIARAMTAPEAQPRLRQLGLVADAMTVEEFNALVASETARWKPVIEELGLVEK